MTGSKSNFPNEVVPPALEKLRVTEDELNEQFEPTFADPEADSSYFFHEMAHALFKN